jgi:parallel beta-helix repeat protein
MAFLTPMRGYADNSDHGSSSGVTSNGVVYLSATYVWTQLRIFVLFGSPTNTLFIRANLSYFEGDPLANQLVHFGYRDIRYPELTTPFYELGEDWTNASGTATCYTGLVIFPGEYIVKCWYDGNSTLSSSQARANIVISDPSISLIHIKNDGSIDPPDASLSRNGDVYSLTADLTASYGMKIDMDNIVLNGSGHVIQSFPNCVGSCGLSLGGRNNVTVRDITFRRFGTSIDLSGSQNCTIKRTVISASDYPLLNFETGIGLGGGSSNNAIFENDIHNTFIGIWLESSFNNRIYHNNFFNIPYVLANLNSSATWDNGYPSGGNYWSGYASVDEKSGPLQNENGGDGIWDSPYFIDANNQDNYPLVNPWERTVDVSFEFSPSFINLETKGRSARCTITLPPGFAPNDINYSSLLVNGTVPMIPSEPINVTSDCAIINISCNPIIEDAVSKGIKFGDISLTIGGQFNNGTSFEGTAHLKVTSAGDVDFDGKVDLFDALKAAQFFGHVLTNPESDVASGADQDGNGIVDIFDLIIIAGHFGITYPAA